MPVNMKTTLILPQKIVMAEKVERTEELLREKPACVSLCGALAENAATICPGGFLVLDFGKEISGGAKLITVNATPGTRLRLSFGESLTEAVTPLGVKNAGNDHSPRDLTVAVSNLSDLEFGQTGFRFLRIQPLEEAQITLQGVFAVSRLADFPHKGFIHTSDDALNRILKTAADTMHMNCQSGYIWDGVKRDRLVWCGDLHPEIRTATYLFGDIENIPRSLEFLRMDTRKGAWVNNIPTYSAWWVVNLCDYADLSGNEEFFVQHTDYAEEILTQLNRCVAENGDMHFTDAGMEFFLDWPSYETPDAVVGTAALLVFAAKKFLGRRENAAAAELCQKLRRYLEAPVQAKQIRAFQVLAGGDPANAPQQLEKNGARGFSTFMSYYILLADALAGGQQTLELTKSYFGGMLSRGATSFWEDFDLDWLENSGRIDALPQPGEKDLHGDYGNYCYTGFRHSLCHGWSSGVYAFFVEYILGVQLKNGRLVTIEPHPMGLRTIEAEIPTRDGMLQVRIDGGAVTHTLRPWEN